MASQAFLAGDVGGTKTRLAIYDRDSGGNFARHATEQFVSAEFPNLQTIISEFLTGKESKVDTGCVGVPGPVSDGKVSITNLPWKLSETEIEASTGLSRLRLVNDLYATTAALPRFREQDLMTIVPGVRTSEPGIAAVVAPGTGLGMGYLLQQGGEAVTIIPSEGGHGRFAPSDQREIELLSFLMERSGYVSNEDLLCGPGIKNIYDFVSSRNPGKVTPDLQEAVKGAKDPAAVISRRALEKADSICVETLEIFVSVLASHCGNTAVSTIATGGIFLGGGIPPKIAPLLDTPLFLEKFLERGKMSNLIKQIPVYLIKDDFAALTGAASLASQEFDKLQGAPRLQSA